MEEHGVVPDVIEVAPTSIIHVKYSSGAEVHLGNELTPTQVKDPPSITFPVQDGSFYTVCMTDPDAPSRAKPTKREWHHWLVVNVPGNDVDKGEVLSGYVGSGPPPGSGLHRYIFLAYLQPEKLNFDEKRLTRNTGSNREKFSIRNFAKKYNLGNPVAGNFYQAQYDDYVPELYKTLTE